MKASNFIIFIKVMLLPIRQILKRRHLEDFQWGRRGANRQWREIMRPFLRIQDVNDEEEEAANRGYWTIKDVSHVVRCDYFYDDDEDYNPDEEADSSEDKLIEDAESLMDEDNVGVYSKWSMS